MAAESLNIDELNRERLASAADSIRRVTTQELAALGESLFPSIEQPWREKFFSFINENSGADFYHAATHDHVHVIYCPDHDRGLWFIVGSGVGPLPLKTRQALQQIIKELK